VSFWQILKCTFQFFISLKYGWIFWKSICLLNFFWARCCFQKKLKAVLPVSIQSCVTFDASSSEKETQKVQPTNETTDERLSNNNLRRKDRQTNRQLSCFFETEKQTYNNWSMLPHKKWTQWIREKKRKETSVLGTCYPQLLIFRRIDWMVLCKTLKLY
jgi:hypothetical protein